MLKLRKIAGIAILSLFALHSEALNTAVLNQFTQYAQQVQADWHVPGMAIAIVQNGKIVYAHGFGERNAEGAPVTPDTIFDIASLTKSFTAALLAMQIDEGLYDWNTKVIQLYPGFKLYDPKTTQEFEVRDLIAHDSGLPADATDSMGEFGYTSAQTIYALRFMDKPVDPFRSNFAYEDVFPVLAKEMIQNTSGQSYSDNLHQHLFEPLQMINSYACTDEKLKQQPNVAWPFFYSDGKVYPYTKDFPYLSQQWALENGLGSGGIESSAADMAKWLIFNMNKGSIDGKQLISDKNMEFIHSPQTIITSSGRDVDLNGEAQQAYGEGWFIDTEEYKPDTVLYHPGGGLGMHALMAYIPQEKIGIVILTNTWGNKVPEALYQRFFDLYFGKQPLQDWNKKYLAKRDKDNAVQGPGADQCQSGSDADLDQYVGVYFNPVYGNLPIVKQGDHLVLTIGPQHIKWQLRSCQKNILKAYWPNPGKMNFPMISSGQDLIYFTAKPDGGIWKMTIPFLNDDGSGIFELTTQGG